MAVTMPAPVRRCGAVVHLLLMVATSAASGSAWAGELTPVNLRSSEKQFLRPIGLLIDRKMKKTATGALISDCHVLTNRHAVGGIRPVDSNGQHEVIEDLNVDVTGNVLEFHIGDTGLSWKATVVASGPGSSSGDWAVLRIAQSPGRHYGAVALADIAAESGETVLTAGYPGDKFYRYDAEGQASRDTRLWQQTGTLQREQHFWTADLEAPAGLSGAPVFVERGDDHLVVGLLRAELPLSNASPTESAHAHGAAQIVPLSGLVEQIRAIVSEHPCR